MRFLGVLLCAAGLMVLGAGLAEAQTCHRMAPAEQPAAGQKISEFGKYEGYSEAKYDSWLRTSFYLPMRDGVRLATDVMIPAIDCERAGEKLPVLWTFTPYKRAYISDDGAGVLTAVEDQGAERLVRHGYIIAAVAIRGTGASFGQYRGLFNPIEAEDAYEITEWLAAQPWSDGKIGMIGGSYQGITQIMLAALGPPHLEAIFPQVVTFDFYESVHPGGIFRHSLWANWAQLRYDLDMILPSPPVDDDPNGLLLNQAVAGHAVTWPVIPTLGAAAFRDHDRPDLSWIANNTAGHLDAINKAAVPIYLLGGWNDIFATDNLLWAANYTGPFKMMIGPWTHNSKFDPEPVVEERERLTTVEEHRWFDYWLKGIENGIMGEDAINYAIITGPDLKSEWRHTPSWPPADVGVASFHFSADNVLGTTPAAVEGADTYALDYTATRGPQSRFNNVVERVVYDDMAVNDAKVLTYTTATLAVDVEVVGFPVVTLYVSSSANDGDFHVFLEEVAPDGTSTYVTEGLLRASQRKLAEPPWQMYGLPYQSHTRADVATLAPDEIVELKFYLIPTATRFLKGNRIRVAIMGADADNVVNLWFEDLPTVTLYRGGEHASMIELPIQN